MNPSLTGHRQRNEFQSIVNKDHWISRWLVRWEAFEFPLPPRLGIDEMTELLHVYEIEAEFILVLPGQFLMGSENSIFNESPPRLNTISHPFFMGRFPVTQRQWLLVCGSNPAAFDGSPDHPVENVSWLDAIRFCARCSRKLSRSVRLPTEAEWEYACRGGTSTEFFFSHLGPFTDDSSIPAALRKELREFAWFDENSRDSTHPVGQKRPNALGLHDMIGNVWEWCEDYWHEGYAGARPTAKPGSTRFPPIPCDACVEVHGIWTHFDADRVIAAGNGRR